MEVDDRILVTTVQGQSVCEVACVGVHAIDQADADDEVVDEGLTPTTLDLFAEEEPADGGLADDGVAAPDALLPDGPVTTDARYGPIPLLSGEALVVVARMEGVAFAPTAQI